MGLLPRFVFSTILAANCAWAGEWFGTLVDSPCHNETRRDCPPTARTTSFALVEPYGPVLEFDSGGNSKAAALIRKAGKKSVYRAVVSGQVSGNSVKVEAISLAE